MRTSLANSRVLIFITAFAVFNSQIVLGVTPVGNTNPDIVIDPAAGAAESTARQGQLTDQANQEAKSGNSKGANDLMMMAALAAMEAAAMAAASQQNSNNKNQNQDQAVQPSQNQTLPNTSSNNPSPSTTPDSTMPQTSTPTDNSSNYNPAITTPAANGNAYNNQPVVPQQQPPQDPNALQATQDPNASNPGSGTTPLKPIPQADLSYNNGAPTSGGGGGNSGSSNNGFGFTPGLSNQAAAATQQTDGPQAGGQGAAGAGISRSIDTLSATEGASGGSEGGSSGGEKSDPFGSVLTSLMGPGAAGALPGAGGVEIMPLPKGKAGKPGPNIFEYATFRYKKAAYDDSRVRVHFSVNSPKSLAPAVGTEPKVAAAPTL